MNQKGFANIIFILAIVVIAGVIGYFVLMRKLTPTVQQTPTPIPIQAPVTQQPAPAPQTSSGETSNWKTYRDAKYGVEFKYPTEYQNLALKGGVRQGQVETWTVKDEYKNDKFFIVFLGHDLNSFEYTDYTSSGKYAFDSNKKTWRLSSDTSSFDEKYIRTLRGLTPTSLNLSFEAYKYSGGSGYCAWDSYLIPLHNKGLMIELQHNVCGNPPTDEEGVL